MSVTTSALAENLFNGEYVLGLAQLKGHGILASLSDRTVRLMSSEPSTFSSVKTIFSNCHPNTISSIKTIDGDIFATCGGDGVKIWDIRTKTTLSHLKFESEAPLLCMDVQGHRIAAGSELVGCDAGVMLWDIRNNKKVVSYIDSHNDDVTDIALHPTEASALLSGSVDGLINLYNTTILDEDDAVYQTINHGASIHRVGFLSLKRVFGLSHMETFSIYQVADPDEYVEEPKPVEFGDIRQAWDCEYVCDVLDNYIALGSNTKSSFKLVPFQNEQVDLHNALNLSNGHGEEVVRSVIVDTSSHLIYTGGEDGIVKVWRADDLVQDQAQGAQMEQQHDLVDSMETDNWQQVKHTQKKDYGHKKHKKSFHGKPEREKNKKAKPRFEPY